MHIFNNTNSQLCPALYALWCLEFNKFGWYIDLKHTSLLILKGNLGCLLVCNYSLMYLDPVFSVMVLKLLFSTLRQTDLYSMKYLLS